MYVRVNCTQLQEVNTYVRYENAWLLGAERHARVVRAADDAETEGALVLGQHDLLERGHGKETQNMGGRGNDVMNMKNI